MNRDPQANLAPGEVFAGYTIVRSVGSGATGVVFLATAPGTGRRVALKIFDLDLSTDTAFRRRLQHSLDILATIDNHTVAQIFDSGGFRGRIWASTEYVDGVNAEQMLREQFPSGIPPRATHLIAARVASGLDLVHGHGLAHGSVTPANVVLQDPFSQRFRIVLTDFGQYHYEPGRPVAGESRYAAPETLTGGIVDQRSDQFSLAATTFHLLTAEPPFGDAVRVVSRDGQLAFDPSALETVHRGAIDVFEKAFAFDPAQRFGSCSEFVDALTQDGTSRPPRVPTPPHPRAPQPPIGSDRPAAPATADARSATSPRRSSRPVLWVAAAALLVTVTLTAAAVMFSKPRPTPAAENPTVTEAGAPSGAPDVAAPPSACGLLDAAVSGLSRRQKLAQLLMVGVSGIDDATAAVADHGVGGIFIGSWTDLGMLSDGTLRDLAARPGPLPLAVSVDEEGGRVQRLKALLGTQLSARELVAEQTTLARVHDIAFERGTKMRGYGITVDFAPVVDVTDAADNTVIGDRSFSADPQTVIAYAGAYAQGLRDSGILPVLKHFPGHGQASGDSHQGGVTTPPLSTLMTSDLVPYRQLSTVQPVAVMVGHMEVPELTGPDPASLSEPAYALLRGGGYGGPPFGGLIFTDDLGSMGAITQRHTVPDAALRALQAGADVALWVTTDQVPAVLDRLETAVDQQELDLARIDDALHHVAVTKNPALACTR